MTPNFYTLTGLDQIEWTGLLALTVLLVLAFVAIERTFQRTLRRALEKATFYLDDTLHATADFNTLDLDIEFAGRQSTAHLFLHDPVSQRVITLTAKGRLPLSPILSLTVHAETEQAFLRAHMNHYCSAQYYAARRLYTHTTPTTSSQESH